MPQPEFRTPFAAPGSPKTMTRALAASRFTAWFVPPLVVPAILAAGAALYLLLRPS